MLLLKWVQYIAKERDFVRVEKIQNQTIFLIDKLSED